MDVTRESSLGLSLEMLAHLPRVQEKSWDLCHLTPKAKHPEPRPRKQHTQRALSECVGVAEGRGGDKSYLEQQVWQYRAPRTALCS